MRASIQQALISVWQQALVDNEPFVILGERSYRVKKTSKTHLRQVDFVCEGQKIRGIEQNPESKSRWAQVAREGKLVMQFLFEDAYVANVADGVFTAYSGSKTATQSTKSNPSQA